MADRAARLALGRPALREHTGTPVFLIDTIDHLEEPVLPQIAASLLRLRREQVDAFVFHNLSSLETFDRLCQAGQGFEQLAKAQEQGLCRFRGISSHHPDVLRAALQAGICDIVMFLVGPFVDQRYVEEILPLAKSLRVGTVCFKTFGAGKLLGDTLGYNQPLRQRPRGQVIQRRSGDHGSHSAPSDSR